MLSFRSEIENPLVEKDIIELEKKIKMFHDGTIHEEKFRSLRLARGIYGQRQQGVQMIRIKLPYGKMTLDQWWRISEVSDEYATGNLHLTTRQDIQIHFVSLDRTPQLWADLERDKVTLREACGNTVRNVTASVTAGIEKGEAFDVTPYAQASFEYFLRNPICQEMGRKFKISFSNTDEDTSLAYIHDLGFIPKIKNGKRGFKVNLGGGLGAQPHMADIAYEFLEENKVIPLIETVLRVFDRHGERNSRSKARLKFLIQKIGLEAFMEMVKNEERSIKHKEFIVDTQFDEQIAQKTSENIEPCDNNYDIWKETNVLEQKQLGLFGVFVRIPLGDISTDTSRKLIKSLHGYIGDDVRVSINQGLFFRNIPESNLPLVYNVLAENGLAIAGANSTMNITACPGTDTCNLAISDSTSITTEFERVMSEEFPDLVKNQDIKIKISGCMNSCGQHGMAQIGFHGSSLKSKDKKVMPALQVLLGGGTIGDGIGRAAEKIIKVPSKRGPDVLRLIFDDYTENSLDGEYFNDYYDRNGKIYFFDLLKHLASIDNLIASDFVDWGREVDFATAIGVGECAAVMMDLVSILFLESDEKILLSEENFSNGQYADAIYNAYSAQVNASKALLLDIDISCNTQMKVISEFNTHFDESFEERILQINKNEPTAEFAKIYLSQAKEFCINAPKKRAELLNSVSS